MRSKDADAMKLSVLMSTYRGTEYVTEQLESLRTQTRVPDEVVVVDDCSPDDTVEVVRDYIESNGLGSDWRVVSNERNKGWQRNFMEGVVQTTGDVVFFADQDDVWFGNKLSTYEDVLRRNVDVNVVASSETKWDGERKHGKLLMGSSSFSRPSLADNSRDWYIRTAGCCMAFRRVYFDNLKGYWSDQWAHDDFLWKMGIMDRSLALLDSSSILHRFHGTNVSTQKRGLGDTIEGLDLQLRICGALLKRVDDGAIPMSDAEALGRALLHMSEGLGTRERAIEKKNPFLTLETVLRYPEIYRRRNEPAGDILLYLGLMRRDKE